MMLNEEIEPEERRVVKFRTVEKTDTQRFLKYFDGLSEKSRYFFHPFAFNRESAEAVTSDADSPGTYRLVAVTGEGESEIIIGYGWLEGLGGTDTPMLGIGIIDEYQGLGVGKNMMRSLIEQARCLGLDKLKLGVFDDNPRAIHVYESVGFKIDPTIPPKKADNHAEIYMILQLEEQ